MRVAICGMSGFIGTNLNSYLKERGYEVFPIAKSDILSGDKKLLKKKISGDRKSVVQGKSVRPGVDFGGVRLC